MSIATKGVIGAILGVAALVGVVKGLDARIASKVELTTVVEENKVRHIEINNVHNKDTAELSTSFQVYQVRHDIRDTDRQIYELEQQYKKSPSIDREKELLRLKAQKEELLRDLEETKGRQRQQQVPKWNHHP